MIHYQNKQVSTVNRCGKGRGRVGSLKNEPHIVFTIYPVV